MAKVMKDIQNVKSLNDLDKSSIIFVTRDNAVKLFDKGILSYNYNGKITGNAVSLDLANVDTWGIGYAKKGEKFYTFPIAKASDPDPIKLAYEYIREDNRNDANDVITIDDDTKRERLVKRFGSKEEILRLLNEV